jgi:hypothetical protein
MDPKTIHILGLAYTDDTVWIVKSKQELTVILDLANQFFDLNDIEINGSKSELLVINPSVEEDERSIHVGNRDK